MDTQTPQDSPPDYQIPDELPGDDDWWLNWPWDTMAEQTDPEA